MFLSADISRNRLGVSLDDKLQLARKWPEDFLTKIKSIFSKRKTIFYFKFHIFPCIHLPLLFSLIMIWVLICQMIQLKTDT